MINAEACMHSRPVAFLFGCCVARWPLATRLTCPVAIRQPFNQGRLFAIGAGLCIACGLQLNVGTCGASLFHEMRLGRLSYERAFGLQGVVGYGRLQVVQRLAKSCSQPVPMLLFLSSRTMCHPRLRISILMSGLTGGWPMLMLIAGYLRLVAPWS